MSDLTLCNLCALNHGRCLNNTTCICNPGFLGNFCQDPVTTTIQTTISQIYVASIIASVFGGALVTLIIGLIIYLIWKRRSKNKSYTLPPTTSSSSGPVVAPALYALSTSYRPFSLASNRTESYHLYDELH